MAFLPLKNIVGKLFNRNKNPDAEAMTEDSEILSDEIMRIDSETDAQKEGEKKDWQFQRGNKSKGGRPPGSKNKNKAAINMTTGKVEGLKESSARVIENAMASGEMPIEYMLKVMRCEDNPVKLRMQAATAAAPYLHAKLAFVQQENKQTSKTALQRMLDMMEEERAAIALKRAQPLTIEQAPQDSPLRQADQSEPSHH